MAGTDPMNPPLRIDVWSDVVCPFCWIGKRRLDEALARHGLQDAEVVYHAFELDPSTQGSRPLLEHLERKFGGATNARAIVQRTESMGAASGLKMDFAHAIAASTFDAHRLILHAQRQDKGREMTERLMRAHFAEALDVSERATLARLAAEAGLDAADAARFLESDELGDAVREDQAAARSLGIRGVPFFVFNRRLGLSGAQPAEVFDEAIRQARGA